MTSAHQNKRYTPIAILGGVGFVTAFGAHIVAVNLPIYAEQVGVGLAMIGLLIAAYDLAEIVAKPVFGTLADRRGMKQTLLAGIGLFILASLSYLILPPDLMLVVRFLQGIGAAALSAVSLALVAAYAATWRGRAYGLYNAIKGAGFVVSPLIGGAIVLKSNFSNIFLASALVGGIAFVLSLLLPATPIDQDNAFDDDDDFSLKGLLAVFLQPNLWPWYVVTVVNMFFFGILFGFLPVRVHDLGYNPWQSGVLLSLVTASYLLVQPIAGVLADSIRPALTIQIGLGFAGVTILLIPFTSGAALALLAVLAGLGVGTVWTNTDALISKLAQSGRLGATMGAAGTFKELGDMLGPLLIGAASQAFGLTAGFVICGLLGLAALIPITTRARATAST
jgi:DHA1 family tetracycline resistance protein-like MFS transporter